MGACDAFRGVVDPSIYEDYILTMLFLKYVSDVWKDHRARYEQEHGDLAHLKHHHHGKEFIALLDQLVPGWRQVKRRLNHSVEILMSS